MFLIQIWSVKTNFIFVWKSWCQTWHILICLRLKLETSINLEEPQKFSDFSISQCSSIFCIPSVQIKLIQFVLSESSFLWGDVPHFYKNLLFYIFVPPYPGSLGGQRAAQPVLSAQNSATSDTIGVQEGWNKNWNVNILRNAFQSLETFFRNFMII